MRADLRQCHWPNTHGGRCAKWATSFLENGLGYCVKHFAAVQELRNWICSLKCQDMSHCKSVNPESCEYATSQGKDDWPVFTIVMTGPLKKEAVL